MPAYATAAAMMVASGSIHAVVNAIVKRGGVKSGGVKNGGGGATGAGDPMVARALTDAASAAILLPAVVLVPLPHGAWGWLAASTLGHAAYLYALVRAYRVADLTAAYPVLRGTAPVVTAIVTLGVLREPASAAQVAGIALIALAMLTLVAGRHIARAALGWSLLTGVMIAGYTVLDAQGVRAVAVPASYIVWLFVATGVVTPAMFAWLSRGAIFGAAAAQWRAGAAAGALSIVSYGLALAAFALGPTAPLAALRETGMVTALLIGVVALGERVTIRRAAAVLGILAGAVLIVLR